MLTTKKKDGTPANDDIVLRWAVVRADINRLEHPGQKRRKMRHVVKKRFGQAAPIKKVEK